ncbi:MAG: cell division ATP-binding protein FtsE [Nitrospira sp.]|nr:cell division ATP-binding protein FtsE [bacterium]MBL7049950.1 cell division ATP-binding protein FtsE [Nitrospira sp.]
MIRFSNVTKQYDNDVVLKNLSLNVDKGEMVYLTGPSGAGKSTLLKLIYCAERPDIGQITVANWDIGKIKQSTIPFLRRNVGIVFQDFRLLENKTVFENIALALRIHNLNTQTIREQVNAVLREVKLSQKAKTYPPHLSGGEQQRVVIARAMVSKPTVLLADEPTGNLDDDTSNSIIALFREINARGTTVVIATHNHELYHGTGRRVLHLNNKNIEQESIG